MSAAVQMTETTETVESPTQAYKPSQKMKAVNAINWNRLHDEKDLEVWNRLTSTFGYQKGSPLSDDVNHGDS